MRISDLNGVAHILPQRVCSLESVLVRRRQGHTKLGVNVLAQRPVQITFVRALTLGVSLKRAQPNAREVNKTFCSGASISALHHHCGRLLLSQFNALRNTTREKCENRAAQFVVVGAAHQQLCSTLGPPWVDFATPSYRL